MGCTPSIEGKIMQAELNRKQIIAVRENKETFLKQKCQEMEREKRKRQLEMNAKSKRQFIDVEVSKLGVIPVNKKKEPKSSSTSHRSGGSVKSTSSKARNSSKIRQIQADDEEIDVNFLIQSELRRYAKKQHKGKSVVRISNKMSDFVQESELNLQKTQTPFTADGVTDEELRFLLNDTKSQVSSVIIQSQPVNY